MDLPILYTISAIKSNELTPAICVVHVLHLVMNANELLVELLEILFSVVVNLLSLSFLEPTNSTQL